MEIWQKYHVLHNVIAFIFISAVATGETSVNKKMLAFQIAEFSGNQVFITTAQVIYTLWERQYRLLLLPPHYLPSLFEVMTLSLSGLILSNFYFFCNRIAWSQNVNFVLPSGWHMMTMKKTWGKQ